MQMLRAKCARCEWEYDVVTLPMSAALAPRVMLSSACPMCGNRKANTIASPRLLSDVEAGHKRKVLANASAPSVDEDAA